MRKTGKERIASRTPEQLDEGRRLERLFRERWKGTQKQFCQQHLGGRYAGGLNQIFGGYTLLTLGLAIIFAKTLKCSVEDFSPRLARELRSLDNSTKMLRSGSSGEPGLVHNPPVHRWGAARMSDDATWKWEPASGKPPSGRYAIQILGDSLHPFLRTNQHVVLDASRKCDAGDQVLVVLESGLAMIRQLVYQRGGEIQVCGIINAKPQTCSIAQVRFMHRIIGLDFGGFLECEP